MIREVFDDQFQIEMSFQRTIAKARSLDTAADSLDSIRKKKLVETLETLKNTWKGERSRQYIAKAFLLDDDLKKEVKALRDAADTVRNIAVNTRNAELRAIQIGRERTY